jgi:outer membrane biosynthesis protein TonB
MKSYQESSVAEDAPVKPEPKKTKKSEKVEKVVEKPKEVAKKEVPKEQPKAKQSSSVSPGFVIFRDEKEDDIKEQHSEWKQKKVDDELLRQWKALSEKERSQYDAEAEDVNDE